MLKIIRNSSEFMLYLVNDLLDFFLIKNGKFKKIEEWIDLKSSLKSFIDMFRVGATEKNILIVYNCDVDFPT